MKTLMTATVTLILGAVVAAVLPARADYSNMVMSLKPMGYWRLDDAGLGSVQKDWATNSGTLGPVGNGAYQANPTHGTNGALVASSDKATYFNGSQDLIIDYNPALNPATNWSAEIWAYPAAASAAAAVMSSGKPAGSPNRTGWVLYQVNDTWSFRPFINSGNLTVSGDANGINSAAGTVTLNAWQHLVVANDGTNCLLYVNGALAGSRSASTYVTATGGGTTIGCRYNFVNFFNGVLDECAFYTNALSAADVLAHYQNGTNTLSSPASYYNLVQAKAPVGYWRLNEPVFTSAPVLGSAVSVGSWGPGANGTYQGGTTPLVPGVPYKGFPANNYGCYFDGSFNSFIDIPAQNEVTPNLTITAWIKRNGDGIYWAMVYSHPNDPGPPTGTASVPPTGINFSDNGDPAGNGYNSMNLCFKGDANNTGSYGQAPTPLLRVPNQEWTFVAMTVCATNATLYMNDQSYTWNPTTTTYPNGYGNHDFSTCDSLIGKKQQGYGFGGTEVSGFLGAIDEVAIFNQALTKDQVLQLYGAALELPPTFTQQPRAAQPLANGLASFAVTAGGGAPFSYQWFFNPAGTSVTNTLDGATNSTYYIIGVGAANLGNYFVQVTNPYGSTNSALATLTFGVPSPYNAAVLALNPVGYWPLNDGGAIAANLGSWGTNAYGAVMGGATNGAPGAPWRGFGTNHTGTYFPGINGSLRDGSIGNPATPGSCVRIPAQSGIVSNVTITCWVVRNGNNSTWRGIVTQRDQDPTPDPQYSASNLSGKGMGLTFGANGATPDAGQELRILWNRLNCGWQWSSGLNTSNQVWAFCGVVFTPTNRTVYLNTQSANYPVTQPESWSGVPAPPEWDFSVNPIFLGYDTRGDWWTENNAMIGTLNDVAIFDRALTTNEMMQIYAAAQVPPIILVQPVAPTPPVYEGWPLSLSVVADVTRSATPLAYQWTKNGTPISGQTGTNYTVSSLATTDTGSYAVVITNNAGAVTSSVVALTVLSGPPVFVQKPVALQRFAGADATFTSVPAGSWPLSYQWSFNNTPIPGATAATYSVKQAGPGDVGTYSLLVSNRFGSTNSGNVTLTLIPVTSAYAAEVVASGPKAYWRFNEGSGTTAFDYCGGFNGTNVQVVSTNDGPLSWWFTGFESDNKAYTWTNSGASQVNLPSSFAINPGAFSIVAWVRSDTVLAQAEIMAQGTATWHVRLQNSTSGFPRFTTTGLTANNNFVGQSSVVDTTWHQVIAVYDGANKYIYVDGSLNITAPLRAEGLETLDASLVRIGSNGGTPRWNGDLDEVAVYDRGLSAAEVANLFRQATSGAGAPEIAVQPVSQVVLAGQPAVLSVTAAGGAPYTYQWSHAGTNLPGAIKSTLTLPSAASADTGTYSVAVNNGVGPVINSQVVTLTVAVPPALTEFANLTNNLVLHLKFDGNYLDSSGRTNNATSVGAPTSVAGMLGQAVHLSAATSSSTYNYLTVSDLNGDLSFAETDSFTVAFWLRYTAGFNDLPIIGNAINSTYSTGWVITEHSGLLEWTALSSGVSIIRDPVGGPAINDGQWHNAIVAFDRTLGQASTYVDGVLVNSATITPLGTLVTGNILTLGQDPTGTYGNDGAFDLDDVGIWRRALSPAEAASIYQVAKNYGRSFDQVAPPSANLSIQRVGTALQLNWTSGTLQSADEITGPWNPVTGATAPYPVTPTATKKFYRVQL